MLGGFHIRLRRCNCLNKVMLKNALGVTEIVLNRFLPPVLSNWYPSLHSHLNVPNMFSQVPYTHKLLNMWHSFISIELFVIIINTHWIQRGLMRKLVVFLNKMSKRYNCATSEKLIYNRTILYKTAE